MSEIHLQLAIQMLVVPVVEACNLKEYGLEKLQTSRLTLKQLGVERSV